METEEPEKQNLAEVEKQKGSLYFLFWTLQSWLHTWRGCGWRGKPLGGGSTGKERTKRLSPMSKQQSGCLTQEDRGKRLHWRVVDQRKAGKAGGQSNETAFGEKGLISNHHQGSGRPGGLGL